MVDAKSALLDVPRRFVLGANVSENVFALRVAAGSVMSPLSTAKMAALVGARHATRKVTPTLIQRWEEGVEPDYESLRILAELAGVSFEAFALGRQAVEDTRPSYQRIAEKHGLKVAEGTDPRAALDAKAKKAKAAKKRPA